MHVCAHVLLSYMYFNDLFLHMYSVIHMLITRPELIHNLEALLLWYVLKRALSDQDAWGLGKPYVLVVLCEAFPSQINQSSLAHCHRCVF